MTVEAETLKRLIDAEKRAEKLLDDAKVSALNILSGVEEEIKELNESRDKENKILAAEISDKYVEDGKKEAEAIKKASAAEVAELKSLAESNLNHAVIAVLKNILGVK